MTNKTIQHLKEFCGFSFGLYIGFSIGNATISSMIPNSIITPTETKETKETIGKIVFMNVSAYCPCPKCCEQYSDGITANGYRIQKNDKFVAAPSIYPFGTIMKIPGYNNNLPVIVRDRGGAIKDNKLDLYFDTHQEALNWGRKHISVIVY